MARAWYGKSVYVRYERYDEGQVNYGCTSARLLSVYLFIQLSIDIYQDLFPCIRSYPGLYTTTNILERERGVSSGSP